MDDLWGPWIEHVPGACPEAAGVYMQTHQSGFRGEFYGPGGVLTEAARHAPNWSMTTPYGSHTMVLRYRIRKPKGLTILEEIIADIPAPTKPKVDA